MRRKGRVVFEDLGAGVWLLDAEDGQRYELVGGDSGLYLQGQRVEVHGRLDLTAMSFGMAAPALKVERYTALD